MSFAIAKIIDIKTQWHGLQYQRVAVTQIEQVGNPPFAGPLVILDPKLLANQNLDVGSLLRIDVRPATQADVDEAAAPGAVNAPAK